jgi:uncharacterized protein YdeI (YjbR/CyaY-like superfamily)
MKNTRDSRIDAYVEKSAPFARPILKHFRELVHTACPEVTETIKWSRPFFEHRGLLCGMAGFKAHCSLIFWHEAVRDAVTEAARKNKSSAGQVDRVTTLEDLHPDSALLGYIKQSVALNEAGAPARTTPQPKTKTPLVVPPDLASALRKSKSAATRWETLTYSHRKEYLQWIAEAKRPETREKRLTTTLRRLEEPKDK